MPKETKREAERRAARIARAHSSALPPLDPKLDAKPGMIVRNTRGYKPPATGLARYPWAIGLTLLLIVIAVVGTLYSTHTGPFAPPKVTTKATTTPVAKPTTAPTPAPVVALTPTTDVATSPCVKFASKLTDSSAAPGSADFAKIQHTYSAAPSVSFDANKTYCAGINTNRGLIVVELDPKLAPNTVKNFVALAENKFYDGLKFHRVVPGFIIQSGDPKGDGSGGPGYKFNDEPVKGNYTLGAIAMANSGPNTNGSQFFIDTADDSAKLQKSYNLFGHVVMGQNVANAIKGPGDDATSKNIVPDVINHVLVMPAS
jgi:cyclophilin family peptidyl-prolyl cis-trans isomerase